MPLRVAVPSDESPMGMATGSVGGANVGTSGSVGGANVGATGSVAGPKVGATGSVGGANVGATGSVAGPKVGATGSVAGPKVGATGSVAGPKVGATGSGSGANVRGTGSDSGANVGTTRSVAGPNVGTTGSVARGNVAQMTPVEGDDGEVVSGVEVEAAPAAVRGARTFYEGMPPPPKAKFIPMITLVCFVFSLFGMLVVYHGLLPEFDAYEQQHLKLPRNIEEAKALGLVLSRYKDKYYYAVLSGIFFTYLFLQSFAIPGSIFLSILCGFLFSFPVAITLICFCSATGASFCYCLSLMIGRKWVFKYFPDKAREWGDIVRRHQDNILNYIIFLRVTPFLPNWFINIAAPVVDVPLIPFWIGTFIGVAPPSFVAIQAGTTLHEMTSSGAAFSWTSMLVLIGLGFVSLIPIFFKDFFKSKFD